MWRERSPGRMARVILRSDATLAGASTPEATVRSTGREGSKVIKRYDRASNSSLSAPRAQNADFGAGVGSQVAEMCA